MSDQIVYVGLFLIVFASLPLILKWVQRNTILGQSNLVKSVNVVSMVSLGASQRLVTVEVGPASNRLLLVLGISAQNIVCLHKFSVSVPADHVNLDGETGVCSQHAESE
jgi:flagellar protein FliO/FliZ